MYLTFMIKGKQSVINALLRGRMERLWRRTFLSLVLVMKFFIRKNQKVIL